MNALLSNLASTKNNPHVSVPMAAALVCEVGKIWFPAYTTQLDATQKILMVYGVISAANSAPTTPPAPPAAKP